MNYPTILPNGSFDAVVLANGEQPQHPIPLQLLQEAPFLVCCDGAIQQCKKANVIVGDGDSIPAWAREQYQHCLHLESEQDDNDLTKATRYCLSQGWHHIAYLGATGLREDHTLGNISLLMRYYREMGVEGTMFTDHGFFIPAFGNRTFNTTKGQQVSIFNFGCHRLASEGLRWNCYDFDQWWQGTLNEALSDNFYISADGYYLVYQNY